MSSGSRSRAVYGTGYGGQQRGTHEPALLRNESLYVKASERPMVTAAAIGATTLLSSAVFGRRRTKPAAGPG